ncbi:MAG: beta(1,3)galactosyltransferase EpsH [Clostridia bacterium]|nr:beta(1,3)galactosyltransferase EpsH [Clostridia bacterium]
MLQFGTQDKEFPRLLSEVERLIEIGKIEEKVIAQIGYTKFETKLPKSQMELIEFTTPNQIQKLIRESNFIITHGGVATIIEGINNGKKVIAVPRLKKYKEHVNDHQLQIIENFNDSGYIIGIKEVSELEDVLNRVKEFEPKNYKSNNKEFVNKLEKTIVNF